MQTKALLGFGVLNEAASKGLQPKLCFRAAGSVRVYCLKSPLWDFSGAASMIIMATESFPKFRDAKTKHHKSSAF